MSSEDIILVSKVLIGILNSNDAGLRSNSARKLEELMQNLGALSFCLLQIASNPAKTQEELLLKTSSLVILRKILSIDDSKWKEISTELKEQIKLKILQLYVTEIQPQFKSKISDVITEIVDLITIEEEEWPGFEQLAATLFTIDPTDANSALTVYALLKLVTSGIGFLMEKVMLQKDILIDYLTKIFEGSNVKIKVAGSTLIAEIISLANKKEVKTFIPFFFTILEVTLQIYNSKDEENLKEMLQLLIELCAIKPKTWSVHYGNIFLLSKKIYEDRSIADEKVRELGFELILSLIERKPGIMKTDDLKILLESIFKYGLESEKEITKAWEVPQINNYEDINLIEEEKINSMKLLVERVIECIGADKTLLILKELINNLISHSDWMYNYAGLAVLANLCLFDIEIESIQMAFPAVFALTKNNNPKIRYLAINAVNKFAQHFNPHFEVNYIDIVIPLLIELFSKETVLRIQCEILEALDTFIEFTTSENLNKYNAKLFEICFASFMNKIPIILRKEIIELIIDIGSTIEEDCKPYAEKSFKILMLYFEETYNSKSNKILYGGLIETLTIIGPYTMNTYKPYVSYIMKAILELIKNSNSENDSIRSDLSSSIERILPVIQEDFKDLTPLLIQGVLSLIQMKPSVSSGANNQIKIDDLFNEKKQADEGMDLNTEGIEDYAQNLVLLITIIETLEEDFAPYAEKFEKELFPLTLYLFSNKIRNKASKVLSNLITVFNDSNVKSQKARIYIDVLVTAISKETNHSTCAKIVEYLSDVIQETGTFLTQDEVDALFKKIMTFFEGLEHNRNKKKEKLNNKMPVAKDDDSDDEKCNDIIEEELEEIEAILSNLNDAIGILLKTHKDLCDNFLNVIISQLLPHFTKNDASLFEQKMGLYLSVDLIEHIGQNKLNAIWDLLFKEIVVYSTKSNHSLRQGACYGIGLFAKNTIQNFDKYSLDLITALKSALNIPFDDDNKKEWHLAHDNIIAAIGKVLFYQQSSSVVQTNLNELLELWISNLPIKYDPEEQITQHEWFTKLVSLKRAAIPVELYPRMFNALVLIFNSKASSDDINTTIKNIFAQTIQLAEMRVIIEDIYKTSDHKIKNRLELLIKQQ